MIGNVNHSNSQRLMRDFFLPISKISIHNSIFMETVFKRLESSRPQRVKLFLKHVPIRAYLDRTSGSSGALFESIQKRELRKGLPAPKRASTNTRVSFTRRRLGVSVNDRHRAVCK